MNSIKYLGLTSFKNLHISPDTQPCVYLQNDPFRSLSNTHLVSKYK